VPTEPTGTLEGLLRRRWCGTTKPGMRLALILSAGRDDLGGIETSADGLGRALAARGHEIVLVAGTLAPRWRQLPPAVASAEVPALPARAATTRGLARVLRMPPLNLQSLSFFTRFLASPAARRLLAGCDAALTFLEGDAVLFSRHLARAGRATVYYYPGAIDRRWVRRDRSTRRVATSHLVAERSARLLGYPAHGVVWPGVSGELLRQPCRAEAQGEANRLVFSGRLEAEAKRPDRLLPLLGALSGEFPGLALRLVGEGSQRSRLQDEAARAGLAERVSFAGPQPPSGVRAELAEADIAVVPSTFESFGVAALEALAAGVPVVASDLPGLREATGGHARLVAPDDLAAWVAATRRLLLSPDERREASRAGRAFASGMTWERAAQEMEPFLFEAVRELGRSALAEPPQARRNEREHHGGPGDP